MPIYAYRCENCGVQFERHQSYSDDSLTVCPECDEPALRKLIQPVGIVFKGSGFYVTDTRGKNGASASTSPRSSEKKQDDVKSSGGESKTSNDTASSTDD